MRYKTSACLHLLAFLAALAVSNPVNAKNDDVEARSYRVWCKVFITERGVAKSIEVLRVEPHSKGDAQIGDAVKKAALTWQFNPIIKNGKPVAGYVTMPMWVN